MSESHIDNAYRKVYISNYLGANIFEVVIHLGCDVLAHKQVKMRGIYVVLENQMYEYFAGIINEPIDLQMRIMEKPINRQYYLVDFYNGDVHINSDVINKGIAKKWTKKS